MLAGRAQRWAIGVVAVLVLAGCSSSDGSAGQPGTTESVASPRSTAASGGGTSAVGSGTTPVAGETFCQIWTDWDANPMARVDRPFMGTGEAIEQPGGPAGDDEVVEGRRRFAERQRANSAGDAAYYSALQAAAPDELVEDVTEWSELSARSEELWLDAMDETASDPNATKWPARSEMLSSRDRERELDLAHKFHDECGVQYDK